MSPDSKSQDRLQNSVLQYNEFKIIIVVLFESTAKAKRKMHCLTTAITATEITRMGYFYKYTCSYQVIDLCILRDARHELF